MFTNSKAPSVKRLGHVTFRRQINMADTEAGRNTEGTCPDTGQAERSIPKEECGGASATGDTASNGVMQGHGSPKTNIFPGVRPPKFVTVTGGNNPFIPKPALHTDVVSTGPRFHTGSVPSPAKFVLRPSLLSAPHNIRPEESEFPVSSMSPLLKPAKLPDPTKPSNKDQEGTEKENEGTSPIKDKSKESLDHHEDNLFAAAIKAKESDKKLPDSSTCPSSSDDQTASDKDNILGQNLTEKVTGVHTSPKGLVSSTGFVFGENLADRVVVQSDKDENDEESASPDSTEQAGLDQAKTLEESAREYQLSHGKKTELQEVEVVTGEENESNVLQANGRLFVFDGETKNWIEKGRGCLRLNDMRMANSPVFQSRVLMRTQGSLRLILNTKIWPGMTVERASQKSVRLTGTTDEGVKVFLLVTNPKDNENILRALDWRIQQQRYQEDQGKETLKVEKRKAEPESPTDELVNKKTKKSEDEVTCSFKREESDSSVLDPETEASSESHASSFTLRTDSD